MALDTDDEDGEISAASRFSLGGVHDRQSPRNLNSDEERRRVGVGGRAAMTSRPRRSNTSREEEASQVALAIGWALGP